jgi:hypothetical protein
MNPTALQQIAGLLPAVATPHSRWLREMWHPDLETQVNVRGAGGKRVEGRGNTYTNGFYQWWPLRIPYDSDSEPHWEDRPLPFPIVDHWEAIGTTGWNWKKRESEFGRFDYDSITGHAPGVGVDDARLEEIKGKIGEIPWVGLSRSTSGTGLHPFVLFDSEGIPTANHNEHAALGRCILEMMSQAVGFDFHAHVDQIFGNVWIAHRTKCTEDNRGFELLKMPERRLAESDLPSNWRDHLEVVTRKRSKVRVRGVEDKDYDRFEALCNGRKIIQLDDKHKEIIDALSNTGSATLWNGDLHLLQTHTCAVKKVHVDLKLKGPFETNSPGTDPGTPNCFLIPLTNGRFKVYRYGKGVTEHALWTQDTNGWTYTYLNQEPDLKTAALACGGTEKGNGKGFHFHKATDAVKALEMLGHAQELPHALEDSTAELRVNKDGRIRARVKGKEGLNIPGMSHERGWYEQVTNIQANFSTSAEVEHGEYDETCRAVDTPKGERAYWVVRHVDGSFREVPKSDVKNLLQSRGHTKDQADQIIGDRIGKSWTLVQKPFQPEYPGGREWNRNAPQFAVKPAGRSQKGAHATWDLMLHHSGAYLTPCLEKLDWAREYNILTGGDYLNNWAACMFQDPFCHLSYLFFHGPERSGKSIVHEAWGSLLTKGYVIADQAITNSTYTGELEGAILAYVEEIDITKSKGARERMKKWITNDWFEIRKMRTDLYMVRSMLHFVQTANDLFFCPVFDNDTRVTVIRVDRPEKLIPPMEFKARLAAEAPFYLRTILEMELPPMIDRLRLPMVPTPDQAKIQNMNRDALATFLNERCHYVPGAKMSFKDFYDAFYQTLDQNDAHHWYRKKVSLSLPDHKFPRAKVGGDILIGNMSFSPPPDSLDSAPYVLRDGKLVLGKKGMSA